MALLRKNAKVEMLRRVPLFSQCSKKELEEIATITDEVALAPGRVVIREGARGAEFFVVVEGELAIERGGRAVDVVGAGGFVGEISLVTGRSRNATVTAQGETRALVITARAFRRLLEQSPTIQAKVMRALAERVPDDGA